MDGIGGIGSAVMVELPPIEVDPVQLDPIEVTPDDPLPSASLPGDGSFGDPIAGFQATNAQINAAVNGLSQQIDATIERMRVMGPPPVPTVPLPLPAPPPIIAPAEPELFIPPPAASATAPASAAPSAGSSNTGSPASELRPEAAALGVAATAAAPEMSSASLATAQQALARGLPWVARFVGTPALVAGLASEVFNFGSIPDDAQERAMREGAERSAAPPIPPAPGLIPPAEPLPNREEFPVAEPLPSGEELPVAEPLPQLPGRTVAPPLPTVPDSTPVEPGPLILENRGDPGLTRPTGEIGAAPTGTRRVNRKGATPDDKAQIASEQEVADRLAAQGYRVIEQPAAGENPILTTERMRALGLRERAKPDLLVEGRVFDIYTPEKDDVRSVRDGIAKKVVRYNQTDRVVVDLRGTSVIEADVRAAIRATPIPGLKEVITLTDQGLGRAFP
ncbi:hypothetical protein [Bradyrhizobium sp. LHD-71]|uniref:CdiA C-terminal domain-containing protein n=1 Tax=Bradyrhizobium sp. LHD-71 TaxID=3072141 RepID=UPI00280D48DE|nr:hypothetical protein [Bradyrhizobium sp. LHD-71]MDQ8726859.1 hypothetical protein [Bradyrhizobium sp. LHD-71]